MLICALIIWALGSGTEPSPVSEPVDPATSVRRLAFPHSDSVEKQLVLPTREQRATLEKLIGEQNVPRVFEAWRARTGTHVDGYAVVDDVIGKSEPITYMLVVEPDLRVRAVEILAYRESRGGEVQQASWRAQFAEKEPSSALRVGKDIRNIAGATISCRSVTDGVRRELVLLDALVGRDGAKANPTGAEHAAPIPAESTVRDRTRMLMDSLLRIQVRDGSDAIAATAIDDAFAEVARVESLISTWQPTSPASALNRNAGGDATVIPPELGELLSSSMSLDRLTNGAFDITAGPIIELWRKSAKLGVWPDEELIDAARAHTGSALLELDSSGLRARLTTTGAAIDLGGIGKGYALDRARAVLERDGVHAALLDFGGQMLALGPPPGEKSWSVDLCDPRSPGRTLMTIGLVDASISSSADHERGLEIAGRRASHIVDPRTGMPVEGMIGASVIRPNATEADALSTALFVMGAENGRAFAQDHGYAALLVDGTGAITKTSSFPEVGVAHATSPAVDAAGSKAR